MSGSSSSPLAEETVAPDEPLGLTVHSLPQPGAALQDDARRTAAGRLRMLLVLAICAAPVIASYFTYYVLHPSGHASHGELIEPVRPLPAVMGERLDGQPSPLAALKGQWLLVSVASGDCDAACEKHLYLQRQLRESLGKDKDRVDWVWLVDDSRPVRPELQRALAQATVLRVAPETLAAWLAPATGHALQDHLYLVDPMGNWMMRFTPSTGPELDIAGAKKIRRDLDRLLRASDSWDQPGR
ncbi:MULTISPECIES: hypothetical protein [Ramlibacter]|uniref:Transmembrane protein n=1 Tax=Ramlibacter aquaticus TaxID=2780094 RepID=A0ABR9SD65_9BURK|nr:MULTISPECIES: hypothetical protein [Ramlibacter]MBE7940290.1 hypothetical protein [Ramlibacter aquaticus]